jgi:polyhydroxybutyrate depolymerase
MRTKLILLTLGLILSGWQAAAAESLSRRDWTVGGVTRQALVHVPPKAASNSIPVVFVFHGHGGTMRNAARAFSLHTLWPEAIVVYPQGLATPGQITDPEGRLPGWQSAAGDQEDRDLKFFDAMLASLKKDYRVDEKRVYATGHSNGGAFSYLLWAWRGERLAALAPSGAAALRLLPRLKPKPVLHVAGQTDPLVRFAWQQTMIDGVRRLNQCGEGKPWEKECTLYASRAGAPLVTFIHPGGHEFPAAAPAFIVKFLKEQALP